jgi:hypothetical protein
MRELAVRAGEVATPTPTAHEKRLRQHNRSEGTTTAFADVPKRHDRRGYRDDAQ